jgi:hypothetical protein
MAMVKRLSRDGGRHRQFRAKALMRIRATPRWGDDLRNQDNSKMGGLIPGGISKPSDGKDGRDTQERKGVTLPGVRRHITRAGSVKNPECSGEKEEIRKKTCWAKTTILLP